MRTICRAAVAAVLVSVSMQQAGSAASPGAISFQGRLADGEGNPIETAVDVVFSLFNASTVGTQLWTETHNGLTPNEDGLFAVMLGETNTFQAALVDFGQQLWLEIEVGGETLAPRQKLTAVPYAMAAGNADWLDGGNAADFMPASTDRWVNEDGDVMTGPLQTPTVSGETASINFDMAEATASAATPLDIPDNDASGVEDTIALPDLGNVLGIVVSVNVVSHTDISQLRITLTDPNAGIHVLHNGAGAGLTELDTSYPTPTSPVSGNLTVWVGGNPAGNWVLKVVDHADSAVTNDGQLAAWRITVQAPSQERIVVANGDLYLAADPTEPMHATTKQYVDTVSARLITSVSANASHVGTDDGLVAGRLLNFTKVYDSSRLRITYSDNFRINLLNYGKKWEVLLDGASIASPCELSTSVYASPLYNHHRTTAIFGYADGVAAGAHQLTVNVGPVPGYTGAADAYTGWNSTFLLEVEEIR